jgi:uncharacterized protein (DUF3820 family)
MSDLDQLSQEVMPFGKHKGKPFHEIPNNYFWYLLKQDWLKPFLRRSIDLYLTLSSEKRNKK